MSREDQGHVTVFIGKLNPATGNYDPWPELGDLGVWENRTGGTGGSDTTKHREGGMGALKSYGGPQTFENAVVAKRLDFSTDWPKIKALMGARGKAYMRITEQVKDEYGTAFGTSLTYTGKLAEVDQGEVNANSGDIRMVTLTQDTDNIA